MEQNFLCVNTWVYFCMNYPDYCEVINYMCDYAQERGQWYDREHLKDKFSHLYDLAGSRGVMNTFYCDLGSNDLRDGLVEYAMKVWAPQGMRLSEEEKKKLGIND